MRSKSVFRAPVERTVLIRLKLRFFFFYAGIAVFFGWAAIVFGFGEPTGWLPELLGPVGRTIVAVIGGVISVSSLMVLVGGVVSRLQFAVAYGDDGLFMPRGSISPAFWVPWLRKKAVVSMNLRNATLETRRRNVAFGESQVVVVIRSGGKRVESYIDASVWDEDDMWRRWAEFQVSLHGVDMHSLPPNAVRPQKSADQVVLEEIIREDHKSWNRWMVAMLPLAVASALFFLLLETLF